MTLFAATAHLIRHLTVTSSHGHGQMACILVKFYDALRLVFPQRLFFGHIFGQLFVKEGVLLCDAFW